MFVAAGELVKAEGSSLIDQKLSEKPAEPEESRYLWCWMIMFHIFQPEYSKQASPAKQSYSHLSGVCGPRDQWGSINEFHLEWWLLFFSILKNHRDRYRRAPTGFLMKPSKRLFLLEGRKSQFPSSGVWISMSRKLNWERFRFFPSRTAEGLLSWLSITALFAPFSGRTFLNRYFSLSLLLSYYCRITLVLLSSFRYSSSAKFFFLVFTESSLRYSQFDLGQIPHKFQGRGVTGNRERVSEIWFL
jgi:hypothetical protein